MVATCIAFLIVLFSFLGFKGHLYPLWCPCFSTGNDVYIRNVVFLTLYFGASTLGVNQRYYEVKPVQCNAICISVFLSVHKGVLSSDVELASDSLSVTRSLFSSSCSLPLYLFWSSSFSSCATAALSTPHLSAPSGIY